MEIKNEIYPDNGGVVLVENDKETPMDDNKIVREDTDVVLEKTNADLVQEMKNPYNVVFDCGNDEKIKFSYREIPLTIKTHNCGL